MGLSKIFSYHHKTTQTKWEKPIVKTLTWFYLDISLPFQSSSKHSNAFPERIVKPRRVVKQRDVKRLREDTPVDQKRHV